MKKIIKLTEADLTRIIKRVIEEQKETISESAVINGITINGGMFLNTIVGNLKNNYKVTVDCGKTVLGVYVPVYSGPVVIEKLWNGKDGGIAGSDNTGKVFKLAKEKSVSLATQMKDGAGTIKTSGTGTIAGIDGACKVTLTKRQ
jgi:hypothetical protein